MRRVIATTLLTFGLLGSTVASAGTPRVGEPRVGEPRLVSAFNGASGHLPEGVAFDRRGNAYVSLGPPFFVPEGSYGEVRRLSRDGSTTTLLEFPAGPAPAGLVADRRGNVFAAVPDLTLTAVGIYRLREGRDPERIPGSEQMVVPNGLAIDWRGTMYASDSALGQIWKVAGRSGAAEPWLAHELLEGCGAVGANGVAIRAGAVYVANSDKGLLIRIPIGRDGSPGEPRILAGDDDCDLTDELWGIDGIAFDVRGNVYAALVLQNELVRIGRNGGVDVLLTEADGLWNPASLAFGTRGHDRTTLYLTNYAVLAPEPMDHLGPALIAVDVGVRGQLVPCRCPPSRATLDESDG